MGSNVELVLTHNEALNLPLAYINLLLISVAFTKH